MGLTYDGITYRSLEEQVRYDAEQVQLLKQADVTINENLQTVNESLQTINTEVNGKLAKTANPSAESAVTMLADGTVGTKLLSEIGGGGGKLYIHSVTITDVQYKTAKILLITKDNFSYGPNHLPEEYANKELVATISNGLKGTAVFYYMKAGNTIACRYYGVVYNESTSVIEDYSTSNYEAMTVTDTYVEL